MKIFIISGPTGSGKGTLLERIRKVFGDDLLVSISATTRKPRPGEVDGIHYHFLTSEEFDIRVSKGDFLEHAYVHGNHYGTLCSEVERVFSAGKHLILEIDMQGDRQLKSSSNKMIHDHMVDIFVIPPALKVLVPRIIKRDSGISHSEIEKRMNTAIEEMRVVGEYSHVIINDIEQKAFEEISQIFSHYIVPTSTLRKLMVSLRLKINRLYISRKLKSFDMTYDLSSVTKDR